MNNSTKTNALEIGTNLELTNPIIRVYPYVIIKHEKFPLPFISEFF